MKTNHTTSSTSNAEVTQQKERFFEIEKSLVRKKLTELSFHPTSEQIYSSNDEFVELLSLNIKENGLFNRIVINEKGQILSGNQRFKALIINNVEEADFDLICLDGKSELEFIISSNQHRDKTFVDMSNEIEALFKILTPGKGKRAGGANTIKRIATITGYTTGKISTIRKIQKINSEFFAGIDEGKITLNGASRRCDFILKLEVMGNALQRDLTSNSDLYKSEEKFEKEIAAYCENNALKEFKMLENEQMTSAKAYDLLFTDKKVNKIGPKKEQSGKVPEDCNCPLCSGKVKNKELKEFIEKFHKEIEAKIKELKED